jgi:hypothetical protein
MNLAFMAATRDYQQLVINEFQADDCHPQGNNGTGQVNTEVYQG